MIHNTKTSIRVFQPCGFTALFNPTGRFVSEPFMWHREQLAKSVA
jgi:hypothetical protein